MDEALRTTILVTLTGNPEFHPIMAGLIAERLGTLPEGSTIALYGCGALAASLVERERVTLQRHRTTFVVSRAGTETTYLGFPLAEATQLEGTDTDLVILLSTRFESEMAKNLAFMSPSRILRLADIIETHEEGDIQARIEALMPTMAGGEGEGSFIPPTALRKARLKAIWQEILIATSRGQVDQWWNHPPLLAFTSALPAKTLRLGLRNLVLRRAGDDKTFLRLSQGLDELGLASEGEDRFLVTLIRYYQAQLREVTADLLPGQKSAFILGCPVWGRGFVHRFLQVCLPSLLDPGNLPALARVRELLLLISTDDEGESELRASDALVKLERCGVKVHFTRLDPRVLANMHSEDGFKYWHLGTIQSIHLAWARSLDADYHVLVPDLLYSAGYFERMLSLVDSGETAVVQTLFRTDLEQMLEGLKPHRKDGVLSVPPEVLTALGLNLQHEGNRSLLLNRRPDPSIWPPYHALLWEERHSLHIISPHPSIGFVAAELIQKAGPRFFYTLDSEIDKLLPEGMTPYFPKAQDGLSLVELSPPEGDAPESHWLGTHDFVARFWSKIETARHGELFGGDSAYPLDSSYRIEPSSLSWKDISREITEIQRAVQAAIPMPPPNLVAMALGALRQAETHPSASASLESLRRAALRLWEAGRSGFDANTLPDLVHATARGLIHFDLLAEAQACLATQPGQNGLCLALEEYRACWGNDSPAPLEPPPNCILGTSVWGEAYVDFFLNCHLPSLLAPGNLPALAARSRVALSLATDARSRSHIESASIFKALQAYAQVHFLPLNHLPERSTANGRATFYQHYGLIDSHHVAWARQAGADLILLPPDTVISRHGLKTLALEIDAGYDACTVAAIEGDLEVLSRELSSRREDHILSLDSHELIAMALKHKTAYWRSLVLAQGNRLNAYPREFFWRVSGGYRCHSLFMHPVMVSGRALAHPFHPNHENVDWALLPRLLGSEGRIRVLEDAFGLFILHCSRPEVRADEFSLFQGGFTPSLGAHLQGIHDHAYPLHRKLLAHTQFFPAEDPEFPVSEDYPGSSAHLIAWYRALCPVLP